MFTPTHPSQFSTHSCDVPKTYPFPDATRYGVNHVEIFVTRATGSKSPKDIANLSNHAAPAAPPAPLNYRDPL